VTEYWIWSNEHGAWWRPAEQGYTHLLHEAGRYSQQKAEGIVYHANHPVPDTDFPNAVAVPVINTYLTRVGLRILDEWAVGETLKQWAPKNLMQKE
jgi:hypothetical protein